jgi:tetratricopeptide (TPR) repeat protein
MMRRCLLVLLLLGALPARADLVEADAAFDAGDHARALALYDDVLRESPDAVPALVRSGMLLSWDKKYPEAIARYDHVLRLEPGHAQASLERAKVLSWSGKNAEAAEAFRALLVRDVQNREARLGLARSLAWAGRQQDARHEYAILLERSPADAEALVGMAQTHAWSGDLVNARRLYEQALASAPEQRDALLGLAYVDLWAGDRGAADSMGLKLDARYPGDPEVAELRREVSKASRPWVSGYASSLDDTDDHRMDTLRLETGFGFRLFDLGVGVVRYDLAHPVEGDSTIQGIYERASFRPTSRQRVSLRLGAERLESPGGESDTLMLGGLSWTYGIGGLWQLTAGFDHDPYRYSTAILVNKVTVDEWRLRADTTPWPAWRLGGGYARGELDALGPDTENTRDGLDVGAWYRHPFGRITGEVGYIYRFLDYAQDLDLGYFDPQDFTSHLLQVRAFGPLLQTKAYWDLTLEGGLQSFDQSAVHVSNDQVLGGSALLGYPLTEALALEATYFHSDYALQSATGFSSRQFGLRVRYRLGGAP